MINIIIKILIKINNLIKNHNYNNKIKVNMINLYNFLMNWIKVKNNKFKKIFKIFN